MIGFQLADGIVSVGELIAGVDLPAEKRHVEARILVDLVCVPDGICYDADVLFPSQCAQDIGQGRAGIHHNGVVVIDQLRELGITVKYDDNPAKRPGFKFADYELKGVPVRLAMGGRDLENNTIEIMRRDTLEKENVSFDGIVERVKDMLEDIQKNIFEKARAYRDAHVYECDNYEEFKERVKDGGFFLCHWDGTAETEAKIKEETQATIRCVPFAYEQTPGVDMVSGKPAVARVIIARSY